MSDFNPIKQDKEGVISKITWSTKSINTAIKGLDEGKKLISNPFYENKTYLLKGDLVFKHTSEEIEEWKKCKEDVIYFANKYCKLMTPEGVKNITLRDYQVRYLKEIAEHRLSILCASRQCGKTTTSAIFLLWFITFNTDKNALVTGNKLKTSREVLEKIKSIFEALSHFLKPGIYKWNEGEIVLDNGCRCMAEATTAKSGIGFTFHIVLADEFAHIAPNIKESFYTNLFPVVTAGRSRFMITSTQNGPDLFCQLFQGAVNGENEYHPFKIDWWDIPEWDDETKTWKKRDEEWHRMQVGNLGSEEAFQLQYGTEFTVGTDALISNRKIVSESVFAQKFINKDLPGVMGSDCFFWKPDYNIEDLRNDFFVFTTDISEGVNQDSTVQQFNKIVGVDGDGQAMTETVGYFKTNAKNDKECCEILADFYDKYLISNHYLVSLEYNLYGELWISNFKNMFDKHSFTNFSEDNFVKFYNESMSKYWLGIRVTSKTKKMACKLFKSDYDSNYIINRSTQFLDELRHFVDKNGNGTYEASFGHDDLVMSQIQLPLTKQSLQFKNLVDEYITYTQNGLKSGNINFFDTIGEVNDYDYFESQEYTNSLNRRFF